MFELECNVGSGDFVYEDHVEIEEVHLDQKAATVDQSAEVGKRNILLKGQMKYLEDINALVFLCSPM